MLLSVSFWSNATHVRFYGFTQSGLPIPFVITPHQKAAKSMSPRGKRVPVWSTPLIFVRLLPEVHLAPRRGPGAARPLQGRRADGPPWSCDSSHSERSKACSLGKGRGRSPSWDCGGIGYRNPTSREGRGTTRSPDSDLRGHLIGPIGLGRTSK